MQAEFQQSFLFMFWRSPRFCPCSECQTFQLCAAVHFVVVQIVQKIVEFFFWALLMRYALFDSGHVLRQFGCFVLLDGVAAIVVDNSSGMCFAGFAGCDVAKAKAKQMGSSSAAAPVGPAAVPEATCKFQAFTADRFRGYEEKEGWRKRKKKKRKRRRTTSWCLGVT